MKAYIALGSNLDNPVANVLRAMDRLSEIGVVHARSSLYLTKPWGYLDQSDFINAVALIDTNLSARQLLDWLKDLEKSMGRRKTIQWGPRLIDLDILTFGDQQIDEPGLTIPHPRMLERAFVLAPLAEIDDSYCQALLSLPAESRAQSARLPAQ